MAYSAKKPRVLRKICPICGTYFHTHFATENKRSVRHSSSTVYYCSPECKKASYINVHNVVPHFFLGMTNEQKKVDALSPYKLLAFSILHQAVEDYKSAVKGVPATYDVEETKKYTTLESLEDFFGSWWAEELTLGRFTSDEMLLWLHKIRGEHSDAS